MHTNSNTPHRMHTKSTRNTHKIIRFRNIPNKTFFSLGRRHPLNVVAGALFFKCCGTELIFTFVCFSTKKIAVRYFYFCTKSFTSVRFYILPCFSGHIVFVFFLPYIPRSICAIRNISGRDCICDYTEVSYSVR